MTPFTRSLRALQADRFIGSGIAMAIAVALLAVWGAWAARARVTLYEVTERARLEVDRAIHPVQSPAAGRVSRTSLTTGRIVQAGEPLVELETTAQRLQLAEEQTRLPALISEIAGLRAQIDAEQKARAEEQQAARIQLEEAGSRERQAAAPAQFHAAEVQRLQQLRAEGLIAERDYQRGQAAAVESQSAAERERIALRRIEQEQRTRDSERDTRIRQLEAGITHLEGQIAGSRAAIARLENEIERRAIRAPIAGRIAEAAVVRAGAVLQEGEMIAGILPESRLHAVAQFPPAAALGRIAPGQPAKIRLEGFPWAQWGAVPAVVHRVAGEVRDGTVRVDLAIDASEAIRVPLQHGLPGSVEIEVERTTPARLLFRLSGRLLAAPRSAYSLER
jgi:membrane fusion protein (multidrug efflux system)